MKFLISTIYAILVSNFISLVPLYAQEYLRMIQQGGYKVQEIIEEANQYFNENDKGRGSGYNPYKRWEYMALRLMDENGYLTDQSKLIEELERFQQEQLNKSMRNSHMGDYWVEMGPDYWNATSGWNPGVGRLTSFSVDNDNPDHIIVGAQTGGVWKTLDGGKTWTPLTDFFSNMAVYSTAIHPTIKSIYFFGSNNGRIYKSIDSGLTWNQIGSAGNSLVNKILIHPENSDLMFASSENSGLYRSTNGGQQWVKITSDNAGFDFAFKPGDLQTVYAAGNSFHKSEDGGLTFKTIESRGPLNILSPNEIAGNYPVFQSGFSNRRIPIPNSNDPLNGKLVLYQDIQGNNHLACSDPANAPDIAGNIVLIRRGECTFVSKVLRAQNAGARAVIIANDREGILGIGGDGTNIDILVVGVSLELGNTLINAALNQEVQLSIYQSESSFRLAPKMIGVSEDDPNRVYILEASGRIFGALMRSDDSGETFSKLDHSGKNYFGYSTRADDDLGQAPRDMAIAVNPKDADEVHIAGINSWVSFDAGITMSPTSDWVPANAAWQNIGYCHADVDIMAFHDTILFLGTDGGLFKATNTKMIKDDYFEDLSKGLGIRQFYRIGVSQTNPARISGGSQDNGTSIYRTDTGWLDWLGADGMETFFHLTNPNIVYGTSQNGVPYISQNGGFSRSNLSRPGTRSGNWVTPFEKDPKVPGRIYLCYEQIFLSDDNGNTWIPISDEFSAKLDHFKIAPSDPKIMFAAHGNSLFKTQNAGNPWTRLTGFTGSINEIAIHPRNPNKIAIATTSSEKVFISEDGGQSWIGMRLNLPNFSALSLVWDDNLANSLYLGMNYGIYYIDDNMNEWIPFNNHLPNVIVNELEINHVERKLYAATYGRGLWVSNLFDVASRTIEHQLEYQITLYPNPAQDFIIIQWPESENIPTEIKVFDTNGKLHLYQRNIIPHNFQLDLTNQIPPGVYYVQLANRKGVVTQKFYISR